LKFTASASATAQKRQPEQITVSPEEDPASLAGSNILKKKISLAGSRATESKSFSTSFSFKVVLCCYLFAPMVFKPVDDKP
jgi:hypothetical protein